jgi:hypothetical protein
MDREPVESTTPDEPKPTAARLACALPFLLGVAIALILLVLFYYVLVG